MKKALPVVQIVFLVALLMFLNVGNVKCYGDTSNQEGFQILTEEFAPFNYYSEDGFITGQSTDVVKEIMKRLDLDLEIQILTWAKGYELAISQPNVILYSTFRTAEREKLFQWVGPIGSDEYLFYSLKNSGIIMQSLEEAKKIGSIAVVKDDARHQFLKNNKLTNLKLYSDDAECYKALKDGVVDLVAGSKTTMVQMALLAGIDPSQLNPVYSLKRNPIYIAFNKNTSPEFVNNWQEVLDAMKSDGVYNAILKKWNGGASEGNVSFGKDEVISTHSVLKLLTGFIDMKLDGYLEILKTLSNTNAVHSGEWKNIKPLLVEREQMAPAGRIWYLLPDGSYYTTVDDLTSNNLTTRSYFPGLIGGDPELGTVVVSKSTGRTVAVAGAPIIVDDDVKGALGTSIFLQNINDEIKNSFPISSNQMFFAVDKAGTITLHSDGSFIGQNIDSISEDIKSVTVENSGKCTFTNGGKEWKAIWTTAPLTNWRVIIANAVN